MSGIGLVFDRRGGTVTAEPIERMAAALTIYGRSHQRVWRSGPVALCYTHFENTPESRLERQPLPSGSGRFALVFDGRIDNRDELAEAIGIPLPELDCMADGTLVLKAWEKWLTATPSRLLGEFAVIVWDRDDATVYAFRDPFGLRALSFHLNNERALIASAPKGIFAPGDVIRSVDEQKIADVLADFYHDAARSFYAGIERLPPGHVLRLTGAKHTLHRYWQPDIASDIRLPRDEDYVEAGRELLDRAVKAQMRSCGTVASAMTGGLDSSAVAVTALGQMPDTSTLTTFTGVPGEDWDGRVPPGNLGDETGPVEAIAAMHPRLRPQFLSGPGCGHDYKRRELFHASETVTRSPLPSFVSHSIHAAARDQGITTLLEGDMGNMTLSWSGSGVLHDLLRRGQLVRLARELAAMSATPYQFVRKAWGKLVLPMLPDPVWDLYMRRVQRHQHDQRWKRFSALNPASAQAFNIKRRAARFGYNFGGRPDLNSRVLRLGVLADDCALETGDLNQGYRALYGIETRMPLWDVRLVEWCLKVPERQYQRSGVQRWLMKRIMAGRLPDSVLNANESGLIAADWHGRMTADVARMRCELDVLASDRDTARLIDTRRLAGLIDAWPMQTPVHDNADDGLFLRRALPHALATGDFMRWVKGAN